MTWTDSFQRADGPIGSDWTSFGPGSTTLQDHHPLDASGGGCLVAAEQPAHVTASATMEAPAVLGAKTGVCVKANASGTQFYYARLSKGAPEVYIGIYKYSGGSSTTLFQSDWFIDTGVAYVISLEYDGGNLTCRVDGTSRGTASDSDYSANNYAGLFNYASRLDVDSFTTDNGPNPAYLTISPAEVYVANPASYLSVTLNGDTWDGPFPAEGVLSVDHGWIITQYRESATLASFSYQAVGYVGEVTVTDAETGATGTFTTRAYPVEGNGDSFPLTADGAGLINAGDATCQDAAILTTCTPIDVGNTVNIPKGIDAILEQLSGFYGQTGADIGTDGRPNNVHIPWKKAGLSEWYTIDNVLGLLGGSPTLYSHADLRTDLSNAISLDTTTITDLVNALSDGPDGDLFKILQQIAYLRTVEGYTLGTVKAWIDAIPPTDLTAITDKLDLIQPSTAADLTTLTNQVTGVDNVVDAINGVLGVVTDGGTLTLQMILDAISALSDLVSALSPKTAPVWPSLAEVTLGTPVAFDGNVDVTATMDGVLVNLTQSPTKTGHYALGNVDLWYGLGRIAFESDNGDIEPWQYLAYDNGLFAPKSMQHASAVHLQVLGGAEGTVTPWTITPPAPAPAARTAKYPYRFDDDDPAGG